MTTMTQLEINKYITEKVLGECWHKGPFRLDSEAIEKCDKCNKTWPYASPDFSLWQHYGSMIRKCMKKEWWNTFLISSGLLPFSFINEVLLNPSRGSAAIAEFLKGMEK